MVDVNMDGALALALANAQAAFPAISRDKEVTVKTKTGGEYKFKYAPLDSILNAVRKPLSENGLAIAQLLDDGELVTMLMHKDGGRLSGRVALPNVEGVQALGSAITYLRRYSIQAILGIAAEEDDDGNHASGNDASFGSRRPAPPRLPPRVDPNEADPPPPPTDEPYSEAEEIIGRERRKGIVRKGSAEGYKLDARIGPEGHAIGFRLETSKGNIPQCIVAGPLGEALYLALAEHPETLVGKSVTVAGILYHVKSPKGSWYRLHVDRIETDEFILPADVELPEPPEDLALVGEKDTAA